MFNQENEIFLLLHLSRGNMIFIRLITFKCDAKEIENHINDQFWIILLWFKKNTFVLLTSIK